MYLIYGSNFNMKFIELFLAVVFTLVSYFFLKSYFSTNLPVHLDGYYHPAFKPVADIFRKNLENGKEAGAAFALFHKGQLVFDMWGGYADVEAQRPWRRDTMTLAFSASKGVIAIVIALFVERGLLDYKRPVADYWPEFSQKDKGNITVEMLLSHQGGLVLLDNPVNMRELLDNPDKVEKVLAEQGTIWPAGSKFGYHGVTYGMYADVLLRKVDPKHRTSTQIFLEDVAKPFGIDAYMNVPLDQYYRTARLYIQPQWRILLECIMSPKYFPILGYLILFPDSLLANVARAIPEYTKDMHILNDPSLREVTMSSASVTGTARGLAKLYGILGNGGKLDDKQLISEATIKTLSTPVVTGDDVVTQAKNVSFGPGTLFKSNPLGQPVFGHTGHGGQVAMVDLQNDLGIAYITNFVSVYGMGDDPRYVDLENAVYQCLKNYLKTLKN